MKREQGYYRVNYKGFWGIAYYSHIDAGYTWTYHHFALNDNDFQEIDENRIDPDPSAPSNIAPYKEYNP